MNIVILKGNITREPEVKNLPSGTKVTEFPVAINEYYKNAAGEKVEKTLFIECQSWGKTGETIASHLGKGDPILIHGKLSIETWDDKTTGHKMSRTRVVIEQFEFCGGKRPSGEAKSAAEPRTASAPKVASAVEEIDDFPF